jgi:hypothetical protein
VLKKQSIRLVFFAAKTCLHDFAFNFGFVGFCFLAYKPTCPPSEYWVKSVSSRRALRLPDGIFDGDMAPMPLDARISDHLAFGVAALCNAVSTL